MLGSTLCALVAALYSCLNTSCEHVDQPTLSDFDLLSFDTDQAYLDIANGQKDDVFTLEVLDLQLYLFQESTVSRSYSATLGNERLENNTRAIPLRGHTSTGEPVTLTIAPGFLMASITTKEGRRWIESASGFIESASEDQYITYFEKDIVSDPSSRCGASQLEKVSTNLKGATAKAMGTCYTVEYAICHDYSMTVLLGSATAVENFGIAMTNEINDLYDNQFADILEFSITGQFISSSLANDPWTTSTDVNVLLSSFSTWANTNLAFQHDDATLWTNRNLVENGNSGANGHASVGSICTPDRYNICEHLSTAGLNKIIVSHQIGHNFNLQHVSGLFVMSAFSAPTFTNWSPTSITNIQAYYNGLPNGCLDSPCGGVIPTIEWEVASTSIEEISTNPTLGGLCFEKYTEHTLLITKSNFSVDNINLGILIDPGSTAGFYDFEVFNTNVTFISGGDLVQPVTVRVYDDAIEESAETIVLSLTINSGNATLGTSTHTITINNYRDKVNSTCCSTSAQTDWDPGAPYFTWGDILAGNNSEGRSRYLLTASQLTSAGLLAGPIIDLQLNVDTKNSTSAYNTLTMKLANYPGATLPVSWIPTTEVFSQSYNTEVGWNSFPFSAPFTWDGTSSLYVEVCFSGGSAGGNDLILTKSIIANNNSGYVPPTGSPTICSDPVNSNSVTTLIPITRIINSSGAVIESAVTALQSSSMSSGETGHFYSDNDKIIASVVNSGPTELSCIDISVETSGNGQGTLASSSDLYSDKTIYSNPFGLDFYDISVHYTDAELAFWSGNINNLSVVKSNTEFSVATESDLSVFATTITAFAGINGGTTFTARVTGSGYFAITDRAPETPSVLNGNLSLEDQGDGIVLSSPNGSRFLLFANSSGALTLTSAPPQSNSQVQLLQSDLYIPGSSAIYLRNASGVGTTQFTITNAGTLQASATASPTAPVARVYNGHFEVSTISRRIIMSSPNGTCHSIAVNNAGILQISTVVCP